MALFLKCPHHAERIICPAVSILIDQFIQRSFYNPEMIQIHRVKMDFAVRALPRNAVCSDRQRTWKYMSSVIIRMLSDQIDTPRRKIKAGSVRISKEFRKFFQQFFFHDHQSPHFLVCFLRFYYRCPSCRNPYKIRAKICNYVAFRLDVFLGSVLFLCAAAFFLGTARFCSGAFFFTL